MSCRTNNADLVGSKDILLIFPDNKLCRSSNIITIKHSILKQYIFRPVHPFAQYIVYSNKLGLFAGHCTDYIERDRPGLNTAVSICHISRYIEYTRFSRMRDRIIVRCFNINSRTYRHFIRGIIIYSGDGYIEILRHIPTNIQVEKDISIISSPPFKVISIDGERSQLHSIYKCGSRHFRDVTRDFYHYIISTGSQKLCHVNTQGNT